MSLYATVRNGYGHLTEADIEHSLDGCLCRCTGYRPILDAAKSFATVKSDKNGASASNDTSDESDEAEPSTPPEADLITRTPCAKGDDCCMVNGSKKGCAPSSTPSPGISTTAQAIQKVLDPNQFKPYDAAAELIFPPYLAKDAFDAQDLVFVEQLPESDELDGEPQQTKADSSARQVWLRPGSLKSLVECMKLYGLDAGGKIRSGNTETGIEVKFKHLKYSVSIFVSDHIKDLAFYRSEERGITVGANLSLTDLVNNLRAERPAGAYAKQVKRAILDNLAYFASNQIRNVATLAGNIATASPISDLNPVWVATGAELSYIDAAAGDVNEKSVNMRDFFLGYRKTALPAGAVITKLFVPWSAEAGSVVQAFKQSKRKDDDIAIVNACLRLSVRDDKILDATLAFGGMGPTTMQSVKAQSFLAGKQFSAPDTLSQALQILAKDDFPLSYGVPGGMPVFRKTLAVGFLTRLWGLAAPRLGLPKLAAAIEALPDLEELATSTVDRPVTKGLQDLENVAIKQPVGDSIPHLSAMKQVTGEAVYIDDMPPVANELHAGFVLSQRAHAKLLKVDATEALRMPGVVDFITYKDIPAGGSNIWNPPSMDETFFAEDTVYTVGQIIGLIVADTKRHAQAAAHKVHIEYEDLPHILTIDEAIKAQSFFKPRPVIHRGDKSDEGWSQYDHVLEGETLLERAMFHIDNCYRIPHLHVEGYICKTNTMSNTAFRGFGGPQGMFFTEDFVHKAAAVLGVRPEAIREKNMYREDDETHFGQKLVDWNVPTLWQQLKGSADYDARLKAVEKFNAEHRYRKRGLAMIPTKFGISFTAIFLNQAYGVVHVYHHDGSVLFSHGGTEMGQGLHTKMAQVVATELGIPVSMVHLSETNTSQASNTSATAASASSDLNGMALKNACDQINASLAKFRVEVAAKGLSGVEAWKDVVHMAYFNRVQLSAIGHYRTPGIGYNWSDGTGDAVLLLYPGCGGVRGGAGYDYGRPPDRACGCAHGYRAFDQSVDRWNYKIPAFLDTPSDMRISFLKVQDPSNPGVARHNKHLGTIQSSKGIGEPPLFLGASVFFALKHAIADARRQYVGDEAERFHLVAPATPERIRVAIGDPLVRLADETTPRREGEKSFFVAIS
ncbi:hypothetical protein L1887_56142 [Cichorium endivia]|nr:hypothetical protein L1887_56142 [Cichorium endivia]